MCKCVVSIICNNLDIERIVENMKKKTKIIITVIVGLLLLTSISLNIFLAIKCGLIKDTKYLSGYTNESWRKNDVYITYRNIDYNRYYSANDDYITHIDFEYNSYSYYEKGIYYYEVKYDQKFSSHDDLEVYFVLEAVDGTRFSTGIETSHIPGSKDTLRFSSRYSSSDLHIVEVWVRTDA